MKIKKIIELHAKIIKNNKNIEISFNNHKKYGNHKISCANYENHENIIIPFENHGNYENHSIP